MSDLRHDEDGDCITLTAEDREHIQAEIRELDARLANADFGVPTAIELRRRRLHLVDELVAGHRLPLPDDSGVNHYRITARGAALGGGWNLKLYSAAGTEMGGGVFPVTGDAADAAIWWNTLSDKERSTWMRRVESTPNVEAAYLAHRSDEAYLDAQMAGDEWLGDMPPDRTGDVTPPI